MPKALKQMHYSTPDLPILDLSKHDPNQQRESSTKRGYNYKWQKLRQHFLMMNPLCHDCEAEGRVVAANVVDHIKPHKGDLEIFWDYDNLRALCSSHHNRKTAKYDGGFGNRRQPKTK